VVTHQLQVKRKTGKVRRPETDVLPLSHATNLRIYTHVFAEYASKTVAELLELSLCFKDLCIFTFVRCRFTVEVGEVERFVLHGSLEASGSDGVQRMSF